MTRRPSLIYETCLRFDGLKAMGVSRHAEKLRLRPATDAHGTRRPAIARSTGRIHSDQTLATYKGIALRFARWARVAHGIATLADLEADANRLVSLYLGDRISVGDSPYTLATTRSGLRMFLRPMYAHLPAGDREERVRQLGADVALPRRRRAGITRSRGRVAMDDDLARDRYVGIIAFAEATGLRRRELAAVTPADIRADADGGLVVEVRNGKGGRRRMLPVLPGHEGDVVDSAIGKAEGDAIFPSIPTRLDCHSLRRSYAQALYADGDRYPLPPSDGRLPAGAIDADRALYVARAIGHNRIDVLLRHYLR